MPQTGYCVTNRWGAQRVKLCQTEMFTSGRVKKEAQKVQEVRRSLLYSGQHSLKSGLA